MTHVQAIRAQILELEAEVRKDPRLAAIQHLKAALAALDGVQTGAVKADEKSVEREHVRYLTNTAVRPPDGAAPRKASKIRQINDLVGRYIDEHGPTHRKVLVQALTDAGLNDGVRNPLTAFATSMHTLGAYFVSDGQGTFRRREGAPSEFRVNWDKKSDGRALGPASSPQGDTGGVAPPALANEFNDMRTARDGAEAGGT